MTTERCVNQISSVAWPLNFLWVIMIDHGRWLLWAHFNRARLIHPLDSATNTTMGRSKELSIDLKEHIIDLNKPGKSLGAISKQLQVSRGLQNYLSPQSCIGRTVLYFELETMFDMTWFDPLSHFSSNVHISLKISYDAFSKRHWCDWLYELG